MMWWAGKYYFGVCIEPIENEVSIANNCSAAIAVYVEDPSPPFLDVSLELRRYDSWVWIESSASLTTAFGDVYHDLSGLFGVAHSSNFIALSNNGTAVADSVIMRFYFGDDMDNLKVMETCSITKTDIKGDRTEYYDGSDLPYLWKDTACSISSLTAGRTYFMQICVDRLPSEINFEDNCTDVQRYVAFDEAMGAPDLSVYNDILVSADRLHQGQVVRLRASAINLGTKRVSDVRVYFFLSHDAQISSADTVVATSTISYWRYDDASDEFALTGTLYPGSDAVEGVYWHSTLEGGEIRYIGFCLESLNEEPDHANNCSSRPVRVIGVHSSPTTIDIAATRVHVPSMVVLEQELMSSVTMDDLHNVGLPYNGFLATTVQYFISTDIAISPDDIPIFTLRHGACQWLHDAIAGGGGHFIYGDIGPDGIQSRIGVSGNCLWPALKDLPLSTAGTFYVGACAMPLPTEDVVSNNCTAGTPIQILEPPTTSIPDLHLNYVTVSSINLAPNEAVQLSAIISNKGTHIAEPSEIYFLLSTDAAINVGDTIICATAMPDYTRPSDYKLFTLHSLCRLPIDLNPNTHLPPWCLHRPGLSRVRARQ